eukprot:CAMPEP_0173183192 /NCGR_PEP_ID=MMETSP1141-20130122/8256_1 /TAXON_ID=483371 /ORGANISM="non described non described, Strain CCMP2298" /LENGTH=54 /DNA_ID=CAMNT_0014106369 /DNA_START=81 /DNA_END=242 /DNA_ORIENTATION=-
MTSPIFSDLDSFAKAVIDIPSLEAIPTAISPPPPPVLGSAPMPTSATYFTPEPP